MALQLDYASRRRLVLVLGLSAFAALPLGCTGEPSDSGADGQALAAPVTVSFQNGVTPSAGYSGEADTTLAEVNPTSVYGSWDSTVYVDADYPDGTGKHATGLLRFDLSSIPANSVVSAAKLTLNVSNPTAGSGYTLYAAGRDWSSAQATWNAASQGQAWGTPGARASSDRGSAALGVVPAAQPTGKLSVALNASGVAAVQNWVKAAASNHGLVLDSAQDTDGFDFDSAHASTASNRPQLTVTYAAPASTGNGTGLTGQYYTGKNFDSLSLTRTDATVNFNWGNGAPASGLPADGFSVRWTGEVLAETSETYTFVTSSDDGVRLWVNGQEIINNWTDHAATSNTGSLALTAGQKYSIKMEYYENGGQAVAQLAWKSGTVGQQIIPSSQLFPTGGTTPPVDAGTPPPPPDAGTPGSGPLAGLDMSGNTIPDTNYPIPSGAIFMSPTGSDSNSGTQAAPVKTLNQAVALAPTGGTIVVRGGVYRDAYADASHGSKIVTKPLTFQAYPHEQAWFDGTDVVPTSSWISDGAGHWYVAWSTPQFCQGGYYTHPYNQQDTSSNAGPCSHWDNISSSSPAAGDPQMLFIDGKRIDEVGALSQVSSTAFFYDWNARRLYTGQNPSGHTMEAALRPGAMILGPQGGADTVRGLGFRRYASNEYENTTQAAIYVGGTAGTVIEDCVFTQMAAIGVVFSTSQNAKLVHNVFAHNGQNGAGANGHGSGGTSVTDGLLVQNNLFYDSDMENWNQSCSLSCDLAHMKLGHMVGWTVEDNAFLGGTHNTTGVWCDTACYNGVVVRNLFKNANAPTQAGEAAVFFEINTGGIAASNLIINYSVGLNAVSQNVSLYNNTIVNPALIAVRLFDDNRSLVPTNVKVFNNVISGTSVNSFWAVKGGGTVGPGSFISGLDYNAWFRPSSFTLYRWQDSADTYFSSSASFAAAHSPFAAHDVDTVGGSDPFFTNAAGGDYSVRSGSAAYHSGGAIPSDVAAAAGVSTAAGQSRGAITWPKL